jgi:hypothetical protein
MYYFETKERKEHSNKLTKLQAELTTLKSKRLVLFDGCNWYTIRESFKAMEVAVQRKVASRKSGYPKCCILFIEFTV